MTGHALGMKLAVSIPDDLFRQLDACARRLRIPRSRLIADGARAVVATYALADATKAWNEVIAAAGQPGAETAVLRRRGKRAVRRASGTW
jgi:metal-responsive CopG/Arc/MetJ family transcriptional regulator